MENLLSHMGIGSKQLTDRYSGDYGAPMHDQHIYYAYEPSPPMQGHATSKHSYGGSGLKSNASMSALTLLAFLFFLHILQQCIKEHMTDMSSTPVVVMSASREGDDALSKVASKIDKSGLTHYDSNEEEIQYPPSNPFKNRVEPENKMMQINAAAHKPRIDGKMHAYLYTNTGDESSTPGFVSAMDDE